METIIAEPLVTVVIPVYNGSNFLGDAIGSVLSQSYKQLEILVINDGSTDGGATKRIAESFGDKIVYVEKANGGVSSALNEGIRRMRGVYLSWLSHDDMFLSTKLSDQIDFALKNGSRFVYGDYVFIDEKGSELPLKTNVAEIAHEDIFLQLLHSYPINGCATLIHKSVLDEVGFFDEKLPTTQDYDFWFRCAQVVPIVFYDKIVVKSRIHSAQDSVTRPDRRFECDELYTRIARYVISTRRFDKIPNSRFYQYCCSLIERRYFSAATMLSYKIDNALFRGRFLAMLGIYMGLSALKTLFKRP